MPITKSAKKALRQNKRRKTQNVAKKQAIKVARKSYVTALASSDAKTMQEKLREVYKTLDKAAKTHAIGKRKASRLKSRMAKKMKIAK